MNKTLSISAMQYDFHTLLKVSDICGLTGDIGFHDTPNGYLQSRLKDLENNIWNR